MGRTPHGRGSGATLTSTALGFYADRIVPRFLNVAMGMKFVTDERKKCLAGVTGTVLEVGFGSGHNLPIYPATVQKLVAVDPS